MLAMVERLDTAATTTIISGVYSKSGRELGTCNAPITLIDLRELASSLNPGESILILSHYNRTRLRDGDFSGSRIEFILKHALWLVQGGKIYRIQQLHERPVNLPHVVLEDYEFEGAVLPRISTEAQLRKLLGI